jgi:hypothetical protein
MLVDMIALNVVFHICLMHSHKATLCTGEGSLTLHKFRADYLIQPLE